MQDNNYILNSWDYFSIGLLQFYHQLTTALCIMLFFYSMVPTWTSSSWLILLLVLSGCFPITNSVPTVCCYSNFAGNCCDLRNTLTVLHSKSHKQRSCNLLLFQCVAIIMMACTVTMSNCSIDCSLNQLLKNSFGSQKPPQRYHVVQPNCIAYRGLWQM